MRGESNDGDTFPAERPKNQSMVVVVVVRGVSMVTHLQLYHRRGGYSLYNFNIFQKKLALETFTILSTELLLGGRGGLTSPKHDNLDQTGQQAPAKCIQLCRNSYLKFYFSDSFASLLMVICVKLCQTNE